MGYPDPALLEDPHVLIIDPHAMSSNRTPFKRAQTIQKLCGVMLLLAEQFIVFAPGFGKMDYKRNIVLVRQGTSRLEGLIGVRIDGVRRGWSDKSSPRKRLRKDSARFKPSAGVLASGTEIR